MNRPRVLLLSGYFDWFSGYQETALAAWLPRYATTEVIASDRVSPMFSDAHLDRLGLQRRYTTGRRVENGVDVTRFSTFEKRSMVWSTEARAYIESHNYDLIIQVMPGQIMPLAGTLARNRTVRVVLYGDNSAMWAHLGPAQRLLKGASFAVSKGALYALVNRRADLVYGYTPETATRLKPFSGGKRIDILPLAFDPDRFFFDDAIRRSRRRVLGYADTDTVVVAAGKFQQKKRLDLLVAAFGRLAPRHPGLRLLLTGADDSPELRDLVDRINDQPVISERTRVMSFVDSGELNAVFNAADIGVWPRMPAITIQQAMGTGLPVVLPENSWVGHLIRPGSGAYFSEQSEGEFTAMERAIENPITGGEATGSRQQRAEANSWLGTDQLALSLLRAAGLVE